MTWAVESNAAPDAWQAARMDCLNQLKCQERNHAVDNCCSVADPLGTGNDHVIHSGRIHPPAADPGGHRGGDSFDPGPSNSGVMSFPLISPKGRRGDSPPLKNRLPPGHPLARRAIQAMASA